MEIKKIFLLLNINCVFVLSTAVLLAGCNCPFSCKESCKNCESPIRVIKDEENKKNGNNEEVKQKVLRSSKSRSVGKKKTNIIYLVDSDCLQKSIKKLSKPAAVLFSAEWCPSCKSSKPAFDSLAAEFSDNYSFFVVDGDKAPNITSKFKLYGIPVVFFFNENGEKLSQEIHGGFDLKRLKAVIRQVNIVKNK